MKKTVLIAVIIIIVACFSWYIIEPAGSGQSIGHQNDMMQGLQTSMETTPGATDAAALSDLFAENVQAASEPSGWSLVWSDDFDAPMLNIEYWTEIDRRDNYNEELQYYSPANSSIKNGFLTLTAKDEEMGGRHYTSGMVETQNKFELLYGRVEARISLPVCQGTFPAFWMISGSGSYELDILEMVGNEPGTIYGVCHYLEQIGCKAYGFTSVADPEAFHVYAIEWDKDEVRWYVDDVEFFSTRSNVPDDPMYIILTLAVGGEWPGSPDSTSHFPVSMQVDYVRIYSRETESDQYDIA